MMKLRRIPRAESDCLDVKNELEEAGISLMKTRIVKLEGSLMLSSIRFLPSRSSGY